MRNSLLPGFTTTPSLIVGSPEYLALLADIESSKSIKTKVFLFDAQTNEFVKSYTGVMACAKDLNIGHNRIKAAIYSGAVIFGYKYSNHRLLNRN